MRCARCTQLWIPIALEVALPPQGAPKPPEAADAEVAAVPVAEPAPALPIAVHEPALARSMLERIRLPGAWALTAVVLAMLVWAAVTRRADIIHAWPPSERAYIALGLAPHS